MDLSGLRDADFKFYKQCSENDADCKIVTVYEHAKNGPRVRVLRDRGAGIDYVQRIYDEQYIFMGHVLMPHGKIAWLIFNIAHGLMMGYSWCSVISYSACEFLRRKR